jgi:pentatricopeptide repeat protein
LDEALKTLKAMQERKIERDIVLHTIIIEGMFIAGKLEVAKELSSKLFVDGMRPTVQTYIKGLLKEGLSDEAYELLRKMEDDGFLPDGCSYNIVIIKGFLQNRDSSTAIRLIDEMAGKRFSADSSTFQMLLLLNELSFFFFLIECCCRLLCLLRVVNFSDWFASPVSHYFATCFDTISTPLWIR